MIYAAVCHELGERFWLKFRRSDSEIAADARRNPGEKGVGGYVGSLRSRSFAGIGERRMHILFFDYRYHMLPSARQLNNEYGFFSLSVLSLFICSVI